jgi:hypothetical protein
MTTVRFRLRMGSLQSVRAPIMFTFGFALGLAVMAWAWHMEHCQSTLMTARAITTAQRWRRLIQRQEERNELVINEQAYAYECAKLMKQPALDDAARVVADKPKTRPSVAASK